MKYLDQYGQVLNLDDILNQELAADDSEYAKAIHDIKANDSDAWISSTNGATVVGEPVYGPDSDWVERQISSIVPNSVFTGDNNSVGMHAAVILGDVNSYDIIWQDGFVTYGSNTNQFQFGAMWRESASQILWRLKPLTGQWNYSVGYVHVQKPDGTTYDLARSGSVYTINTGTSLATGLSLTSNYEPMDFDTCKDWSIVMGLHVVSTTKTSASLYFEITFDLLPAEDGGTPKLFMATCRMKHKLYLYSSY